MTPISFNNKVLSRTVDNYGYTAYNGPIWLPTTFYNVPEDGEGDYIWHADGDTYWTHNDLSYKLDVSTKTWSSVNVGTCNVGTNVWNDGNETYVNIVSGSSCYVYHFDHNTKRFTNGVKQDYLVQGKYIWKVGGNVYFSGNTGDLSDPAHNLVWDRSTNKWKIKTWYFSTPMQNPGGLMGSNIWQYKGNTYCGDWNNDGFVNLYKLNTSTSTWNVTKWNGFCDVTGIDIWYDYTGEMYYCKWQSGGQWHMNTTTDKWDDIGPSVMVNYPMGRLVWSDGTNIYYNDTHILKR